MPKFKTLSGLGIQAITSNLLILSSLFGPVTTRPQRIKAPPHRKDLKKYCEYHKDHFHDTDDYRLLKAEIEKLIKRGHLREFVKKDQVWSPRRYGKPSPRKYTNDRRGDDHSPHVTRSVDTISGGITGGGHTSNARKKYSRMAVYALGSLIVTYDVGEISFSDKELVGLELPHDDPLRAYDKLGLSRKHLNLVATPLTGVTGHSIHPVGIAELDVIAGNGSRMVTVRAFYTVVDITDPSYNGLIGQPLLTALRAIVSPLHLKMKFPTPGGVREMSGDQKRERECYRLSIPRGLSMKDPLKRKKHQEKHPGVMNLGELTESECQDNDPKDFESQKRGMPHEDLETVVFDERQPDRVFRIGIRSMQRCLLGGPRIF
ncbi:hypothetical protein LIER_08315 [Lithospermum erythrorhizon]|uniref:Uncharacterized protein n=1 Tax=Lithospermum erythrorhizon TaxID=34254 RepID=A0AAV3PFV9_LITER